jgi:hypothetical protein
MAFSKEDTVMNLDLETFLLVLEFIPIKPLIAMAADAGDSYATHSRFP